MDLILSTNREKHTHTLTHCLYPAKIWLMMSSYWIEKSGFGWALGIFFYLFISIPTIILQSILITKHLDDMGVIVGTLLTMLSVVMGVSKTLFLLIQKKNYRDIYHEMLHKFWPLNWCSHGDGVLKKLNLLNKYFWLVGISNLIVVQIWLIFPYADPLPGHRRKPVLIVFPESWGAEEFPVHHIMCFFIFVDGVYVATVVAGFDALFLFTIYNTGVQFQLLKKALHNLAQLPEEKIQSELKFIVDYHQYLTTFSKKICGTFALNNGLDFCTSLFLLSCFFCYYQTEEDNAKKVKLFLFLFTVVGHMVIYGVAGSWFISQQEAVADAAYCSDWYNKHPRLRLSLIHILQIANRPYSLSAFYLAEVNCGLVVSVLKTAFSVGTLFSE